MFCNQCGNQLPDDAGFCNKCGASLSPDKADSPESNVSDATTTQPSVATKPSLEAGKKKGKSKLLPVIIIAAVLVVAVIVIALNLGGKIDYVGTVKTHQPFAISQELPYTYGSVIDKFIVSPKWTVRESDDTGFVDISGKITGTDHEAIITIKVVPNPDDPDDVLITPEAVTINGEKSPTPDATALFMYALFTAYDEGEGDLPGALYGAETQEATSDTPKPTANPTPNPTPPPTNGKVSSFPNDALEPVLEDHREWGYDVCEYALYDVDQNGIDELFVRYRPEDYEEFEDMTLYTYANGEACYINEFSARFELLLNGDGNLYTRGSESADNYIMDRSTISDDGTEMIAHEVWEQDGTFYSYTSINGSEAISQNEYNTVFREFDAIAANNLVDRLDWQLFYTTEPTGELVMYDLSSLGGEYAALNIPDFLAYVTRNSSISNDDTCVITLSDDVDGNLAINYRYDQLDIDSWDAYKELLESMEYTLEPVEDAEYMTRVENSVLVYIDAYSDSPDGNINIGIKMELVG